LIHLSGETLVRKTSFQRIGTAGLAALTLIGLLSACSSKKSTTAASSTASTASTASAAAAAGTSAPAAAAAASPTAALPSPSKVVATGGGTFCKQVAAEVNNSVAQEAATSTNAADAVASIKQSVQQFQAIEGTVLKSAPSSIKPDMVTLFGAIDQFYSALAKVNYDFTKVDPSIEAPLETPAVQKAETDVDAYLKNTCGIDTGDDTDSSAQAEASAAEASALAEISALVSPSS
jgi:hypothetical protein